MVKQKIVGYAKVILGALIMASGWGWYHLNKHNIPLLAAKIAAISAVIIVSFLAGKRLLRYVVGRLKRHPYWQEDFLGRLEDLFFALSCVFVIFFFRSETASVVFVLAWLPFVFWRLDRMLASHPAAHAWQRVNRVVALFVWFVCALQAACQLAAYYYYILDSNIKFFNIVLFRSVAMTGFWLGGFAAALWLFWLLPKKIGLVFGILWSFLFTLAIALWVVNIGILYYSGLYFSPSALDHAHGGGGVAATGLAYVLGAIGVAVVSAFVYMIRTVVAAHRATPRRVWQLYAASILVFGLGACLGLSSFRNTPERTIVRGFYQRYFGNVTSVSLPPALQEKLQRFGLSYDPQRFLVTERSRVYGSSSCVKGAATSTCPALVPPALQKNKPNLVILFLESYSARLTGVYNPQFKDVTPGLNAMAADPDTTVFKNYYNASTPTITGILSLMCSFLPPTGHNEIQNDRKLQSHRLLCLPEMLKKYAGFKYANYITAVDKEFAHKDGIFTSMGIDQVFGTKELARIIPGEPLAWGYSDHQMFPTLLPFMRDHEKQQPFLLSLSTVDTHPPFNLAKDELPYGDGKQDVLNTFYTTDDAFFKFWKDFKASPFASNTIVIAVADHAIFPAALTKDLFPREASSLTYYDENTFLMYVPSSTLPNTVTTTASGIDFTPTLLQLYGINATNTFEGHSIFDDRSAYPNLVGMHELGLYINQQGKNGARATSYDVPDVLDCPDNLTVSSTAPLTLCELKRVYQWKRRMLEEGRLWKP